MSSTSGTANNIKVVGKENLDKIRYMYTTDLKSKR